MLKVFLKYTFLTLQHVCLFQLIMPSRTEGQASVGFIHLCFDNGLLRRVVMSFFIHRSPSPNPKQLYNL